MSRSRLQSLIRQGWVQLDGQVVAKPSLPVRGGEVVVLAIPPPRPSELIPESIPLDVVFENQDLLLVNKPAGMVVHPSPGHHSGTLVHAALAHAPDLLGIGDQLRPGVVHRLDKGTSGLIVLAKHEAALRELQRQFKSREVEKVYLALVAGRPPTPAGKVEAAIGRDRAHRQRMAVVPAGRGRAAATHYATREQFPEPTLLEAPSPGAPTRSACIWPTWAAPSSATRSMAAAGPHWRCSAPSCMPGAFRSDSPGKTALVNSRPSCRLTWNRRCRRCAKRIETEPPLGSGPRTVPRGRACTRRSDNDGLD
jgi:hypothetical protein